MRWTFHLLRNTVFFLIRIIGDSFSSAGGYSSKTVVTTILNIDVERLVHYRRVPTEGDFVIL